ncbi:MAG: hypothetical protein IPH75_12265 [bacterium]|nr:hypothetical protein [bacterium]
MKQFSNMTRLCLCLLAGLFILGGCIVYRDITIKDFNVEQPVRELATAYPEHFNTPFTLLVLIDENATCGVREISWWRDWQSYMHERGWGFALATTQEDSLDLVTVMRLDSIDAPILIVPNCQHYLKERKILGNPLNLLVDSAANIHYACTAPDDTSASRHFLGHLAEIANRSQRH